ncbi:hypothetical protein [Streptomyces sp. CB01881]|uniref:hypothetical protein n=1 Tax=Streptomyces sp. CB01881 TaxID=2078691 RepID=UPI000CDCBFC7|nr:hypothetical protein [Streptomyces sp. CB01881]AUY48882.1 hypothetical protein C2142_07890 [Streptomyces sp. CB01881]TYC77372.1 hypothetical protein EH183_07900 [Streptomyces sp. CB01881]
MRALLEIEIDTATTNKLISDGEVAAKFERIMGDLKPEAAYFFARNGRRCQVIVVDLADEASLPSVCEPFWLEFNATVEVHVCMNAEELREGLGRLAR